MDSLCSLCKSQTKYSCVACNLPLCNKCAIASNEMVEGYDEENKRVGKCPDCDTDFAKDISDCSITDTVVAQQPPKKHKSQIFHDLG